MNKQPNNGFILLPTDKMGKRDYAPVKMLTPDQYEKLKRVEKKKPLSSSRIKG